MDEKRTALAVLLSILVILVYQRLNVDQQRYETAMQQALQPAAPAQQSVQSSTSASAPAQTAQIKPGTAASTPSVQTNPTSAQLQASARTVIESEIATIIINHLGARIESFKLKNYAVTVASPEPLDLVQRVEGAPLPLGVYLGNTSDAHTLYTQQTAPTQNQFMLSSASGDLTLNFSGQLADGTPITKQFKFSPNSYLFNVSVDLSNNAQQPWIEWPSVFLKDSANESYNPHHFTLLGEDQKIKNIPALEITAPIAEYGANTWAAYGDKYFLSAVIPSTTGLNTRIGRDGDLELLRVAGTPTRSDFMVYVGPKEHSDLQRLGLKLERSVDLGMFSFLAHPLLWMLKFFHSLLNNWGLAIILLTLVVKAAFLPLTQASFKSMQAMQDLQPEIKALRERVKDPNQLNQETMALYKKRGVNPMGGCLPMVIQIPVFLGLYNALLNAIELRHAPFALWINDLSTPESLQIFGIGIPVMILIMGLSMFAQQWTMPSTADPAQKKAMMLMPFVFTIMFIVYPFPAGLVLYWLVNNVISITQQVFMRKQFRVSPLHATMIASVGIFAFGFVLTLI